MMFLFSRIAFLLFVCWTLPASAGELTVVSVDPPARVLTADVTTDIRVTFDRPVDRDSVIVNQTFWAFARWSGTVTGTIGYADGDATVILTPTNPLSAGESVMVILSHDLMADDGSNLRSAGYSYQFWTRAQPGSLEFEQIDTLSTRTTPGESSRAYGGIASDLNGDRFLDITVVNEDTADLRVFLNLADGTGLFDDFLQPTFPVNQQASPSEPADFNRDGVVDICVANISTSSVSVLLGNGDGTFAAQQEMVVGNSPRGIAALDADGDGDLDIANTNFVSSNMSVLLNNGSGAFGAPLFWEGGASGERALAAADMNEDGILDLAIGAISAQQILVNTGNGNGTFSFASSRASGGQTWQLVTGDVNADGHDDVAVVNSGNSNGAILLGDGAGQLAAPSVTPTDPFAIATDLGDLDGDGDLDWLTSSFSGDWRLFRNNGDGTMVFDQEFAAPAAASCSVMFDFDNDGDMDLGLIDEIADVIVLMRNVGCGAAPSGYGDANGDGMVDIFDILCVLDGFAGTFNDCAFADVNLAPCPTPDAVIDIFDILAVLDAFAGTASCCAA
ncbi:MAG: hypothetical protein HOP29_15165 [Phycisphaerales bacterium]|nr:hypothetical protein [Phycisphaerales bacterium]